MAWPGNAGLQCLEGAVLQAPGTTVRNGCTKLQENNEKRRVALILQECGLQRDNRISEELHQVSTTKSGGLEGGAFTTLKSLKEKANQKRVLKCSGVSDMTSHLLLSIGIQDHQLPKGCSRAGRFCGGFSEGTVPKTFYGGEEHEEENAKDLGSEKTASPLQESSLSETAMSDMTICQPPVSMQNVVTIVQNKCPHCEQPPVVELGALVLALHTCLERYLQSGKQTLTAQLLSEEKVQRELTENAPKETGLTQSLEVRADSDDSSIDISTKASGSEQDPCLEKILGEESTQEEDADETESQVNSSQANVLAGEDQSSDGVCCSTKTLRRLLKKCIKLAHKLKSFPCAEESHRKFIRSSGAELLVVGRRERGTQSMLGGASRGGRSAADGGGGQRGSGHNTSFTFQGGGGRGAGGAGREGSSGGRGDSDRGRRDDPGREEKQHPSRDVADQSSIPQPDFRRNCEAAHAHLSSTVLFDILGAVGTPHWGSVEGRWLGELQRCLGLVLHDVQAREPLCVCSVCAVLHSLLSHFVHCQQQPCAPCARAFFLMQFHAHTCLSVERSRERFSQADICYHVCLAVSFDPQLLRCLTERVWSKMHKYLSKVLTVFCTEEEESQEQASQQHTLSRSARRKYAPSLSSIAEDWSAGSLAAADSLTKPSRARVEGEFLSSNSGTDLEACGVKHKLRCAVPVLHCDFAGAALPAQPAFAEVGSSVDVPPSLLSTSSQGSQSGEVWESQPQPSGREELDWPYNESRIRIAPEMPRTYGSTGCQSMPDFLDRRALQGSQQHFSLETQPVGKPGIGEVVYGTKYLLQGEARFWGRQAQQLQHQSRYQRHLREEGVILDSFKDTLRVVGTRYQKHVQWRRLVHLGSGVSGKCSLAVDLNSDQKFCVKRIHLSVFGESELETWSEVDHRNIVQLYGAVRHGQKVYIFAEFIDGGNLSACINRQRELNRRLSHWSALCIFQQILQALVHLKSKGIVHEDLKADNILIRSGLSVSDHTKPPRKVDLVDCIQIAIADFGTAQRMNDDRGRSKQSPVGAPTQWSPEKAASQGHSFPADVWAATCVLVHMLSGSPPWMQRYGTAAALHYIIFTKSPPLEDVPENIQHAVRDLIQEGFTFNPIERPSGSQLLQHSAFQLLRANMANPDVFYSVLQSPHSVDNRLSQQHCEEGVQQMLESLQVEQPPQAFPAGPTPPAPAPTGPGFRQAGEQEGNHATPASQPGRTVKVIEVPGPSFLAPVSPECLQPRTAEEEAGAFVAYSPPLLPVAVTLTLPGSSAARAAGPVLHSSHPITCSPALQQVSTQVLHSATETRVQVSRSSPSYISGGRNATTPLLHPVASSAARDFILAASSTEASLSVPVVSTKPLLSSDPATTVPGRQRCSSSEEGEETEELLMHYVQDLENGDWPQNFPAVLSQQLGIFAAEERKDTRQSTPPLTNIPTFLQPAQTCPDDLDPSSSRNCNRERFDSSDMFSSEPAQSRSIGVPEQAPSPRQLSSLQQTRLRVVLPDTAKRRLRTMSEVEPADSRRAVRQCYSSHPSSPQRLTASEATSSGSPRNMSPFDQQEELFREMNQAYDESDDSIHLLEKLDQRTSVAEVPVPAWHSTPPGPRTIGDSEQLEQLQSRIALEDDSSEAALDSLEFKREDGSHLRKVRLPRRSRDWRTLWELILPHVRELGHMTLLHSDGSLVDPEVPPSDDENCWTIARVAADSEQCWCETHFMMR